MDKKAERARALDILVTFLRFGCFTFGGGWSIVAQIQKEFVEKRHWITGEELLDFTSVGRSVPGLMVANVCLLFGYRTAGVPGALCAVIGISLPPFFIMLLVTAVYGALRDHPLAARAMAGVRAAVVPIIISALTRLFRAGMKNGFCYLVAAVALILCLFSPLNNVVIVLLGALAGILYAEAKHVVP